MPIPEIFLWQTKNTQHEKSYWTVDGQQRLTTIIDFINGKGDPKKNPKFMIKSLSRSRLDTITWIERKNICRIR